MIMFSAIGNFFTDVAAGLKAGIAAVSEQTKVDIESVKEAEGIAAKLDAFVATPTAKLVAVFTTIVVGTVLTYFMCMSYGWGFWLLSFPLAVINDLLLDSYVCSLKSKSN